MLLKGEVDCDMLEPRLQVQQADFSRQGGVDYGETPYEHFTAITVSYYHVPSSFAHPSQFGRHWLLSCVLAHKIFLLSFFLSSSSLSLRLNGNCKATPFFASSFSIATASSHQCSYFSLSLSCQKVCPAARAHSPKNASCLASHLTCGMPMLSESLGTTSCR